MKKIITHINPDLDAAAAVWVIKRFLPGWEEAEVDFIEATADGEKIPGVDSDPEVLYVDVGRGKLDHHQTNYYLSATRLCWDYVLEQREGQPLKEIEQEAGKRLVEVVTQVDNAKDLNWKEVGETRYYFYLHILIDGLRGLGESDQQVLEFGFRALDAVFLTLKNKIRAEEDLKNGIKFQTKWGEGIALESANKRVLWEGEIQGFVLVVKKDPKSGAIQIYARPDSKVNLTAAYQKIKKIDSSADWFLHASGRLLLNESSVNPNMRPTKLTLEQIIEVLKS